MIEPVMDGWIEQWYVYVPGWVKVNEKDAPVASGSEEKDTGEPVSDAMAWVGLSLFIQVTVVPVFTVRVEGSNAKFLIVIVIPPVGAGCGVAADGAGEVEQPAAMHARITRIVKTVQIIRREYSGIIP
jgi:hypothetical protein